MCVMNRCEIFRDNNHQSLYKNIKRYNDIDCNPGPVFVNESTEYCYLQGLFKSRKKNSCTPCVPISYDGGRWGGAGFGKHHLKIA